MTFPYDDSFRADHHYDREPDNDPLLVCDSCYGVGSFCDLWGSWQCSLCHGTGTIRRSIWLAHIHTLPCNIRDHWLEREPPIYQHNGGDPCRPTQPLTEAM